MHSLHSSSASHLLSHALQLREAVFIVFCDSLQTEYTLCRVSIQHLLEIPILELRSTDLDWAIGWLDTLAYTEVSSR